MNPPNISVIASGQKWRPSHQDTWHLTRQLSRYEHNVEAVGGYWSARFTIRGGRNLADDWLQDGLGRHIESFGNALSKCWEGFVNKITVNYGPLSVVRGPLLDVANRVQVVYSAIEYDEDDNPIVGTRTRTDEADDEDSQDLWGILPKILSTGGADQADAEDIRDTYLENYKTPRTSKDINTDSSMDTSVTVDCLGYVHWLNWAYNTTSGGEEATHTKISNILGDTPNVAWLDFNTEHIDDSNALTVPAWEDEDKLAWSAIKDVCARGDDSNNRWLFGIYNDMEAWYYAASTTPEYQQRLSQPRQRVETIEGDEVYPWSVGAGRWIIFPDFLIGQASTLNPRDDQRCMFIESVRYIAPWSLQIKGGAVDTIDAVVAQLGIMGIGA